MKNLRWSILGAGQVLRKYAEAFRLVRGVSLIGVASRDAARAQTATAALNARRAYHSYEALITDPEVDIVLNALHNGLHCEWSVRALEAGKHVLCEKPLACSSQEVEQMFAAAHAHQRWLMEGFMYRFHPQMTTVKRSIDAGEIGRILSVHCRYTGLGPERSNPRYRLEAGGGALMDLGCYCVNFSRFIAASEPTSVVAHARFDKDTGVDLTTTGILTFANNLIAQFTCSFQAEGSYSAEVIGTEGKWFIPHPWLPRAWPAELMFTRGGKSKTILVHDPAVPQHYAAPFVVELERFARCVREGRVPTFSSGMDAESDSRGNMRVIDALFSSVSNGQVVDLTGTV